jgi:hypothetical protein
MTSDGRVVSLDATALKSGRFETQNLLQEGWGEEEEEEEKRTVKRT